MDELLSKFTTMGISAEKLSEWVHSDISSILTAVVHRKATDFHSIDFCSSALSDMDYEVQDYTGRLLQNQKIQLMDDWCRRNNLIMSQEEFIIANSFVDIYIECLLHCC